MSKTFKHSDKQQKVDVCVHTEVPDLFGWLIDIHRFKQPKDHRVLSFQLETREEAQMLVDVLNDALEATK